MSDSGNTGFYKVLSRYYHEVFPLNETALRFLKEELDRVSARVVLDLACGIGTYSVALAKVGFSVTGTDLEETLITLARENADKDRVNVRFSVSDMKDVGESPIRYDAVICIGNSLAHLLRDEDLRRTISGVARVLRPGGTLVVQVVNFDRVLRLGGLELPRKQTDNLVFTRRYVPDGEEQVRFFSRLTVNGEIYDNEIKLRAVTSSVLIGLLTNEGFEPIRVFGDFNRAPYEGDSPAIVVVADRPKAGCAM
ncbi:MAG: class I SAM-dependent methyltransferase [Bacillota bacterium]